MKAVFHTGTPAAWADTLGGRPWCLAPVGGKPLVETWLEWAARLGARDVRIVLGEGADEVEGFCGDGSRWGLRVTYGFLKNMHDPAAYLRRSPTQWAEGLLYIAGPVFPRRLNDPAPEGEPNQRLPATDRAWFVPGKTAGGTNCFLSEDANAINAFIAGRHPPASPDWADLDVEPLVLDNIRAYYDLNLRLVRGEISRYVRPGFGGGDGACIGSNVVVPPSVELRPPLIIGNNCRIHPMAVIGPDVVIGNGVIIDRQTEISGSVIMDDTYLGPRLEIRDRVVAGARLIDPTDGTVVDIADPWLLAPLNAPIRASDFLRAAGGWLTAVALTVVMAPFFFVFHMLLLARGAGAFQLSARLGLRDRVLRLPFWIVRQENSLLHRAFTALSLDLFPLIALAAIGRIWLCGHAPLHPERDAELRKRLRRYYPAAIGYHTLPGAPGDRVSASADAFYYERYRAPLEDARILLRVLTGRLLARVSAEGGGVGS